MRKPLNLSLHQSSAWRGWALGGKPGLRGTSSDFSFSYAYDKLGRPVSRSGDAFRYDARGQVTNAVLDSAIYRYAYDHIGNRQTAYEDGVSTSYSANSVNQYTAVGSEEPDYDADGNLVDDGTRTFEWSAAGHLAAAATSTRKYESTYDYRGRRVKRTEYRRVGNNWRWVEDRDYVYDDWNLVYEHREHQSEGEAELSYYWGPDLSGSLQGAGGVGGLVAVSVDGDYYFPGYDNNGNVIGYWNEDGDLVAEYAYDAFGNTIYEDGDMADFFPHRFSTKYYDAETDLYYYGYRYYSPRLGRWISRDPIEERGGNHCYTFNKNSPTFLVDFLGLFDVTFIIGPIANFSKPMMKQLSAQMNVDVATTRFHEKHPNKKLCSLDVNWVITSRESPLTLEKMQQAVAEAVADNSPIIYLGEGGEVADTKKQHTPTVLVKELLPLPANPDEPDAVTSRYSWEDILGGVQEPIPQVKSQTRIQSNGRTPVYVFCCYSEYLPKTVGRFDLSTRVPENKRKGIVMMCEFQAQLIELLESLFCCD